MRTSLSTRREKFYGLIRQANEQPSQWLIGALKEPTHNQGLFTPLARLACLRILVCRSYGIPGASGLPYPQRKQLLRRTLGV